MLADGDDRRRCVLGERDASFVVGDVTLTHPADRGRVPELPGPDPRQPAEPADGRPLGADRRVAPGGADGPRGHAGAADASSTDSLELLAITQDVGQATEAVDAKYEGAELTVAFNPEYLLDGPRGHRRATRSSLETVDALQAGAAALATSRRTSSTC